MPAVATAAELAKQAELTSAKAASTKLPSSWVARRGILKGMAKTAYPIIFRAEYGKVGNNGIIPNSAIHFHKNSY